MPGEMESHGDDDGRASPGWYQDGSDPADVLRWWDGLNWTGHTCAPVTQRDKRGARLLWLGIALAVVAFGVLAATFPEVMSEKGGIANYVEPHYVSVLNHVAAGTLSLSLLSFVARWIVRSRGA